MPQKQDKNVANAQPSRVLVTTYRTECTIDVAENTTGLEIIADVCDIFKLPEPAYFGVKVKRGDGMHWLDNDENIRQSCGKKWRDEVKVLEFKIRFFPPDITRISDDNIIHTYFIHTRDQIIKGEMLCDPATAIVLAALTLQAESGSYDPNIHDSSFIRKADCLPTRFSRESNTIINSIIMEYKQFRELSTLEAEVMFLEKAQQLAECGVEYYPTKDKSGETFRIGAGHDGIFIKHNKIDNLILFKWLDIVSMSYDQKYLWLEVQDKKPNTFEMASKGVAALVFAAFVAQHNFKLGKRLPPMKTYGEKRHINRLDTKGDGSSGVIPTNGIPNFSSASPSKTDLKNRLIKMLSCPEDISVEYMSIPKVKSGGTHTAANLPENKPTNRFRDIVPYDDTRVVLKSGPRDYINANLIDIKSASYKYILCQGPKENTVNDFWQMVWENGVKIIAMVTQLREGYRAKCNQYWPESEGAAVQFGDIEVRLVFERDEVLYITRGLSLRHLPSDRQMDVIQLQFTSWPDHGVPKTPKDLLDYLEEIQGLLREVETPFENAVPLLIHCSAGVGRSGVLLMIDLLTRAFNSNEYVDIPSTLREVRQFRSHAVQTEEQYLFIYSALLAYINQSRLI